MDEPRIQARIVELEQMREEFIKEANLQVNARVSEFNGAIAELKRLLDEEEGDADDDDVLRQ